jgi:uncharacterized protein YjlB
MAGEVKNFDSPDETRPYEGNGEAQVVNVGGQAVGKGIFEPGWTWANNVKPIAQTDSCQAHHVGYCLSGAMSVQMDDGTTLEISAGDVFDIPPGHNAEVTGDEACVQIDFSGFGTYAKRE